MEFLTTLRNITLIATFCVILAFGFALFRSKKRKRQIIYVNTGTVGSGKTFLSVAAIVAHYAKVNKMYSRSKKWFYRFFFPSLVTSKRPVVYSNIPLYLNSKLHIVSKKIAPCFRGRYIKLFGHIVAFYLPQFYRTYQYSEVLTREHLLIESTFPDDVTPIVLIDELGTIANQYSYSDPHIVSSNLNDNYRCIETFIRFFRHYYGEGNGDNCRLFITDQSSGNITVGIRRRLSTIDYLSDFHRWLFVMPFYKVHVREMLLCDDNMQNVNQTQSPAQFGGKPAAVPEPYYFGFLPYKRFSRCHYDSHAYSQTRFYGFVPRVNFTNWQQNDFTWIDCYGHLHCDVLKTNYCPDLRMSLAEKKAYKARIAAYGLTLNDVAINQS